MKRVLLTLLIGLIASTSYSQCWNMIDGGGEFILATKANGTLWGWGANSYGQLGLGSGMTTNQLAPVQIGSDSTWQYVSAGGFHSFAIKTDGTLWGMGYNFWGQIGNGSSASVLTVTQIGTDADWAKVSCGGNHTIAIRNNGKLYSWGCKTFGQLGNGTSSANPVLITPTLVGNDSSWVEISAGGSHNLAIKSNGTLWAWGKNDDGQLGVNSLSSSFIPVKVGTDSNWVKIATSENHSMALKSDGTLWAWGTNSNGELGNGTFVDKLIPTMVGTDSSWVDLDAGAGHSVAVKNDGTLWVFGINSYGQFGNGATNNSGVAYPTLLNGATNYTECSVVWFGCQGLRSNGLLMAWGRNNHGQVGSGTTSLANQLSPIAIGNTGCIATGIDDMNIESGSLNISPNPSNNTICFFNDNLNVIFEKITVFNLNGKAVIQKESSGSINVETLSRGMYFIQAIYNNQAVFLRFVKE